MAVEKAGGYISQIKFNNEKTLDVEQSDIVIFVGPNNAGKSQSLKDIFLLAKDKISTVVISDIKTTKKALPISKVLSNLTDGKNQGKYTSYNVLGHNYNVYDFTDDNFSKSQYYGDFRNLLVANLDTSARLTICDPPATVRRDGTKTHPIHYAAFDESYRKWISQNFKKAFDVDIIPYILFGSVIPFCMGTPVKLDGEYEDEQSRQEAYAKILETYKQVQNQGDGIKSFTGILLYLMLDYYCTYLIDEPESFLHPPQAYIMGQIIGQTLKEDQQAFISTHSEEIIKGLLEVCPKRIKIVRITREGDTNKFSILNNEEFNQVWNDPLLKYSNIMSSLFHKSVVLCESDSDCKMYSVIESHLKQKEQRYSETLFIHCGGKHRMAKIIKALRSLQIDVKLIPDFDVLNDENIFKGIVEAFDVDFETIRADYNIIVSNLHSDKEKINRAIAKTSINQIIDAKTSAELSKKELENIREIISVKSKWDGVKKAGVVALPAGDATSSFRRIDALLKEKGVFIVPVGELECFIKEVGGHGPEWVNNVLEKYPELDNDIYKTITDFIKSID